jgi:type VI secretion system FHA domain protein
MTSVGIEDLLLEGADAGALKRAALKAAAGMRLETDTSAASEPDTPQPRQTAEKQAEREEPQDSPEGSPSVALYAFLRGAGLEPRDLDDQQAALMLHHLGQLMRELVIGLTDAIHFRAQQKSNLRMPGTIIQPTNNNVLKFSASVDEAINALITDRTGEYLSAIDSTREAYQDLRIHQQAMHEAVQVALSDFIDRLDPTELQQEFDHGMKRNAFIGAANKLRYWELYADTYQSLSQRSPGRLPQAFADELSRAYEEEASRLKGKERQDKAVREAEAELPHAEVS